MRTPKRTAKRSFATIFLTLLLVVVPGARSGWAAVYDVIHTYNLQLTPRNVYQGVWAWSGLAHAVDPPLTDNDADSGNLPFVGSGNALRNETAIAGGSTGSATSQFNANLNGTGFHEVFGSATAAKRPGANASARSTSALALNVGTDNRRGQVRWSPAWHIDTISDGVASDPMSFSVLNLDTSATQDSTFWDTGLTLNAGGSSDWSNGNISVNGGPSGSFFITMESPYLTSPQGHIHVAWSGGVITSHDEAGIFAGLAPALGLPANFGLHVGDPSGNVDMNFDFGPDNTSGFNMSMNASNSGSVSDPGVPEPATAALGILGMLSLAMRRGRNKLPRRL